MSSPPTPQFPDPGSAPRSKSVVGGLPWHAAPANTPSIVTAEPKRSQRPDADDGPGISWDGIRERLHDMLPRSPAFTVSLIVHVLLLLVLAVIGIRQQTAERLRLELSFGQTDRQPGKDTKGAEVEAPAVAIEPAPPPAASPAPARSMTSVAPPPPVPDAPAAPPPAAVRAAGPAPTVGAMLAGRGDESRSRLVGTGGGSAATESAVSLALEWLVRQQRKDGLWSLQGPYVDGGRQENRLAASAMALLALQGAGNTPDQGRHRDAVDKAWNALLKLQQDDGTFDAGSIIEQHQMYAHGQITIAVCEAYGMTKDARFRKPAQRALDYALAAQMPDGGWRYQPPRAGGENRGDMSVSGWYLMALKSAEMAGLDVPSATFERLSAFVDGVFVSPEKGYGYQISPGQKFFEFRPALTAEALLCRQYLGWRRDDPRLVAGVDMLLREAPIDFDYRRKNVYAWYYETQVCHHMGGPAWDQWNTRMQDKLLPAQVGSGREKGSWDPAEDQWGYVGGRLFMTSLCACMLEVYYRHLPLYGEAPAVE